MALSIHCPHCNQKTALSVSANDSGHANIWENRHGQKWWIGICNGCGCSASAENAGLQIELTHEVA